MWYFIGAVYVFTGMVMTIMLDHYGVVHFGASGHKAEAEDYVAPILLWPIMGLYAILKGLGYVVKRSTESNW